MRIVVGSIELAEVALFEDGQVAVWDGVTGFWKPSLTALVESLKPDERLLSEGHEVYVLENSSEVLWVHDRGTCSGKTCPVHKKSDHPLRAYRQHWRDDRHMMERICQHGIGHPDLDVPWAKDDARWIHGCDGCCGC